MYLIIRFALACCLLPWIGTTTSAEPVPVIDCHVHFWRLDRPEGIGWIDRQNKTLFRSYLPQDFNPIAQTNQIGRVVVVQAGQHLPDNQWNLDVTAKDKRRYAGVVGNLSKVIGTGEFRPLFEELCKDDRYVGYRLSGRYQQELNDAFFDDLQLTAEKGRTVDLLLSEYTLADVDTIATRLPRLKMILDHFGNVVLDGKPLDPGWVKAFRQAARHRNVYCKVSALYGRVKVQPAPKDVDFYRPVLDLAVESFGYDRLIYGSDWPVSNTTGDYASVLRLTRDYFSGGGRDVVEKIFSRNAIDFYGLQEWQAD